MLCLGKTAVVLIDMQGKLWNVMYEKDSLLANSQKLVKGMGVLGVPIVFTEQNPAGLGPTLPDIANLVTGFNPVQKFCFNCYDDERFRETINELKRKLILVCGIETHICVYQTAMDLLVKGFEVQVIVDCVSSRVDRNRDVALSRMQSEGIKLTTSETVLFELLKSADNPDFKELLKVIK